MLEGFEFNNKSRLSSTLSAPYAAAIDRATGTFTLSIEAFTPIVSLRPPIGATHFSIAIAGAAIDFATGIHSASGDVATTRPINEVELPGMVLSCQVTVSGADTLIMIMGVRFYQEVNGVYYPLNNGTVNPLSIIKVDA